MRKLFILILFFINALAYANQYKFDPANSHHTLYIPNGKGPFPAILLLHASTGVVPINHDWAMRLKNKGYIVYVIDSFKPRGWSDRESVGWEVATDAQFADVAPAYAYLSQLSIVNASRIGVLGFSMGGFTVLRLMQAHKAHPIPFKAAASFYGVCHRLAKDASLVEPTTIFIGSDDDRSTTNDCQKIILTSSKQEVKIKIYPSALHGFDNYEFPSNKEVIDEKGERYHIGYNQAAAHEAQQDLSLYFDEYLK